MLVSAIGGLAIGWNLGHKSAPAAAQYDPHVTYAENLVEVKYVRDLFYVITDAFRVIEFYDSVHSKRVDYAAFNDMPLGARIKLSVTPYKVTADFFGNDKAYSYVSFFDSSRWEGSSEYSFRVTKRDINSLAKFGEADKGYAVYVKFSSGQFTDQYQADKFLAIVREAQRNEEPLRLEGYFSTIAKADEAITSRDSLVFEFIITKINGWEIKY